MKERLAAIFLLFLALLTIWAVTKKLPEAEDAYGTISGSSAAEDAQGSPPAASPTLADEVIRLHILADSDSEEDQQIKLLIRDALLPYFAAATVDTSTKEDAKKALSSQCGTLTEIANQTLKALGADYSADVFIGDAYFPIRIYGSQTYLSKEAVIFPPGSYTSVQVVLGRGEGHNWWCLAYPSLCFIDATYEYIPKESAEYKEAFATIQKSSLNRLFYGAEPAAAGTEDTEVNIYVESRIFRLCKELLQRIKEKF